MKEEHDRSRTLDSPDRGPRDCKTSGPASRRRRRSANLGRQLHELSWPTVVGDCELSSENLGSKSSGEFGHFTGTIDEFRRRHAEAIHHGDKEIGERDVGLETMIGTMVETEAITSRQDERIVGVVMSGAVAAAVKNHGVVEKGAFVFAGVLQALEEI